MYDRGVDCQRAWYRRVADHHPVPHRPGQRVHLTADYECTWRIVLRTGCGSGDFPPPPIDPTPMIMAVSTLADVMPSLKYQTSATRAGA
jgi:hypothetical protein